MNNEQRTQNYCSIAQLLSCLRTWSTIEPSNNRTIKGGVQNYSQFKFQRSQFGFTLIELLTVIGIIGILSTILVVAVNPARQFAKARDAQRETDLIAILSAVYQYSSEHSGAVPDTDGNAATSNFPSSLTCIGSGGSCFNLAGAGDTGETIVPVYMASIPKDPQNGTDANTGYTIMIDANDRLTASASGETKTITVTR